MKPIAWSCWNEDMPSAIITFTEPDKYGWQSIKPLYTTPQTKPLSNQEILKLINDNFKNFSFEADYILDDNELIKFAKLLEESHGIK